MMGGTGFFDSFEPKKGNFEPAAKGEKKDNTPNSRSSTFIQVSVICSQ